MAIEKIAKAMSWSVVARVTRFAAGIAANIIIVRSLGAHGWGVLSVLKSFVGFAFVMIMLGLGNAMLKYTPAMRVRGAVGRFFDTFKRLILLQVGVWLLLLILTRLFSEDLDSIYAGRIEHFSYYLFFAIAFVLFEVFMVLITNMLQSWYETKSLALVIFYSNLGYIVILMLFIKSGFGIIGILAAGGIVNLAASLALFPTVRNLFHSEASTGDASVGVGKIMKFSLPFVVTGILNQIVWRQSEVIFLGHFHGAELAGFFGLAYRFPQLLLEFIPLTIWPIVMAGTSEAYEEDAANLPKAIELYYKLLYILVIPVAALGFAISKSIIPILYGETMAPAALFAQLFFVVFSYSFLYTPLSLALYVLEKSWVNMIIFLILAVVNVGLDLALIPKYGLWGAFIPVSIVLLLGVFLFFYALRRFRKDVRVPVFFIAKCYAAAIPAFLIAVADAKWSSPFAVALQFIAGAVLLVAGFRFFKVIGSEEKELMLRLPIPFKEKIVAIF